MLRINDNVKNLDILSLYGFTKPYEKAEPNNTVWSYTIFDEDDVASEIIVGEYPSNIGGREIKLYTYANNIESDVDLLGNLDVLYDMIYSGIVEKVND